VNSVLDACQPRPEIIAGTFNPEVFTASLRPIVDFYRGNQSQIDHIYTQAKLFFQEATYPTQGLKTTLAEVFARISGDLSVPAIHRLETSFGGGKTHTLIACTHIAFEGSRLHDVIEGVLNPELLPKPGSVDVVAVAGDEIPVHKPKGESLVPYTLWGEIAYQIGGESLYREVEEEVDSHAAPGKSYFERVFSGRKVLIMLDELAQYAARLEAARPDGANQLAAFLMTLHGHARNHSGIAVVLTLASATDAFSRQTERLAKLMTEVRGQEVSEDDALGIGEEAVKDIASVVARDAVQVTPVQAAEISSVLAKRLFQSVNRQIAEMTAESYMEMYRRNAGMLPEEASNEQFKDRLIANYPFHPTLIDFLNKKLTDAENFQGTRGVLRVLALAVRSLWERKLQVPMVHACHLDLRSERVVNEILGRTGSSDLFNVLNADIGGVDTGTLEGGRSNAEEADRNNSHPQGHPLYEYTWKTVFLHSLVGREQGIQSRIFGLTESEAVFAVAFPELTPSQVRIALTEIDETAYYLRNEQGKYFAGDKPTINSVLARIRKTLGTEQIKKWLEATAQKVIKEGSDLFHIEHDVSQPEHIPDGKGKPIVGVVSLTAESIDVEAIITTKGPNRPREQQNHVFLLVPETVSVGKKNQSQQGALYTNQSPRERDVQQRLVNITRQVLAFRELNDKPQNYGVNPRRLKEDDFQKRRAEREQALITAVSEVYTRLFYPTAGSGQVVQREIRMSSGEGGHPVIRLIRDMLIENKELLTERNTSQADLSNLSQIFFQQGDTISIQQIRENFARVRKWLVLESERVLDQIIRIGVQKDIWYVFRMNPTQDRPDELYRSENVVPMSVNLLSGDYSLIKPQGAKQRGWMEEPKTVDIAEVQEELVHSVASGKLSTIQQVREHVDNTYGTVSDDEFTEIVTPLVKKQRLVAFREGSDSNEKPELIQGTEANLYLPKPDHRLITPDQAEEKGLITKRSAKFEIEGEEGARKLLPLLKRLGSLYNKGAKSTIDHMDLVDLQLPEGGTLRIELSDVSPASMKMLGELFEVLNGVVEKGNDTEAFLEINDPDEKCAFIQELKNS
jgi:hypothetical protein